MLVVLAAYFALRRAVLGTAVASQLVLDQGLGWPARLLALPHLAGLLPAPFLGRIDYSGSLPPGPLVPAALAGVALLAVLGLLARRARTGPSGRPFAVLLACGAVSLAPAAAVIAAKGVVGDRLVYLAAAFLLPAVVVAAGSRLSARRTIAVGVVLVVACGTWAGFRSLRWRSQRALFEEAIAEPHASSRVYTNLGIADHDEGRLEEAVDRFEGALARGRQEKAHYMLGLVYTELGCDDLAIRHYGEATAINPGDATAANNLGALLAENGRRSEAERVLVRAIARNRGRSAALRTNLEILRAEAGAPAAAPAAAQPDCGTRGKVRALLRDPRFLNRRANERLRVRQFEQSRVLLDAAERLAPDLVAVHLNRAQWHVLRGEFRAARRILEDVLRREPGNVHALRLLERISSESHLRLPPRSP
jgi:Flp pilus assembly protein TadD